jgi:hypothetical protein
MPQIRTLWWLTLPERWKHASSLNTNLSASSCRHSLNSKQNSWQRLWSSGMRAWSSCNPYGLQASLLHRICDISNSSLAWCIDFWGLLIKDSRMRSTVSGNGPGMPVLFAVHKQPVSSNFLYHSLIVLSVGGSVWYLVRKPHCTVIIDSVLASYKTQKYFCSPGNAMFPHYCLLVEKWVTKPRHKTQEGNLIVYSFHWHALIPCRPVCFWARDLRNPRGSYEARCMLY